MKVIEVKSQTNFNIYDNKVKQGEWTEYHTNKNKLPIRQNADGHSYKVYEHNIELGERICKGG
ncbi:MAG: hypothetical protein H0W50_11505 [Parachlamydiaceae bacterium]|nr:hypothetical protein [Parachlamydiaceae bacterium]